MAITRAWPTTWLLCVAIERASGRVKNRREKLQIQTTLKRTTTCRAHLGAAPQFHCVARRPVPARSDRPAADSACLRARQDGPRPHPGRLKECARAHRAAGRYLECNFPPRVSSSGALSCLGRANICRASLALAEAEPKHLPPSPLLRKRAPSKGQRAKGPFRLARVGASVPLARAQTTLFAQFAPLTFTSRPAPTCRRQTQH